MRILSIYFFTIIVTLIGMLHTVFNIYVLKMKPMDKDGMDKGYVKTKPWYPLHCSNKNIK